MNCAACGHGNPERAKFCLECGAALASRCPGCGTDLPAGAKFCLECGTALGGRGSPRASDDVEDGSAGASPSPKIGGHAGPRGETTAARKVVTIVFADLAGSTALHERLDPESVGLFMESYYRAMRGAVETHGGTVVKLLGDGVMAAFGVPRVAEDDAIRAVRAAVAMQQAFRELARNELAAVGDIGLRVALNTGEVVVSADNTDVVGDPVNVAARLQQEAHDGEVVLGESTRRLVSELVTLAPLGSFALKGRAEAVKAYRVESLERPAGAAAAAFVGRDDELAHMTAVYDAALAAPGARLAVLLGSPGLGKSRLIDEFTRRLGESATVLTAHCDAAGGASFAPLAQALRELLRLDDGSSGDTLRAALEGAMAGDGLRATLAASVGPTDAERARIVDGITALLAGSPASPEETFFVVRRLLAALASVKPVVLVIDDLHWAESLLLDLVEHLVQWGSGVPLLVLVGARPELRDRRSSLAIPGGFVAEVVTLSGLDAGAATRLAANMLGAADLPAAVAAKVLAASEGNPLFVGELVRMLVHEGALERKGDRWTTGVGLAALEMPPTIHALLAARIERLRPEERGVLEHAAVVGRHFSRSAVAALLPREIADLDARLESLRRSELVEPDTGWFLGEPALRFHHVLIRDAAYRRLLKGKRAELHARFADWIEARAPEAVEHDETIGWHLEQAHQHLRELGPIDAKGRALGERAARHLAAAGRRALARDDLPLAASLLGRALERLDADDPGRAELALDWCEALLAAGDVGPAAAAIDELGRIIDMPPQSVTSPSWEGEAPAEPSGITATKRLGRSLALPVQSLDLVNTPGRNGRLRAWHTCFVGQLTALTAPQSLHATADAVAAAAAELAALGDTAGEAKAHFVHAQTFARLGRIGACEAALDRALAAARKAGDRRRANTVLAVAPLAALWGPSPVTRASGRCLDVVRVLRITQGAPAVEAVALSCQGVLEALRGRTDAARRMVASARKMVEDLGITQRLLETDVFAGRIELLEGDPIAAERCLRPAYEGLRDLGLGIDAARTAALLGHALLAQDRAAEAEALSRESEALAGDDLQASIAWRGVRAEALARSGDHTAAVELARAAVEIAAATDALLDHADARRALAAALRAAGRNAEAEAEERRATELWETKGATLLVERARDDESRVETVAPKAKRPEAPSSRGELSTVRPTGRRRVRVNAAAANSARIGSCIEARDLGAIARICADDIQIVHHPFGLTYGYREGVERFRLLFQATHLSVQDELLATLGEALVLSRNFTSFSGLNDGELRFGASRSSYINLGEFNDRQQLTRIEIFAEDRLSDAIVRLYERYAERLPEGPARTRAAATAHAVAVLNGPIDSARLATAMMPSCEIVDHRHLGTWSARGAEEILAHWRHQLDLTTSFVLRDDDVLALEPDAFLVRRAYLGSARDSGGAFENLLLDLIVCGEDGLLASSEVWEPDREAEALARFDEVTSGGVPRPVHRRVRANAAADNSANLAAALAAADVDATERLVADSVQIVHHPTGSTYGRAGLMETFRRFFQAKGVAVRHELLATLGDSLALSRQLMSYDSSEDENVSVGAVDHELVLLEEVDGNGRRSRAELFAPDHLGDAIARLYGRYAELLPEGPERRRAAMTARALIYTLTDATTPDESLLFDPGYEDIDHRSVGYGKLSTDEAQKLIVSQRSLAEDLRFRVEDVLALRPDGLVRKSTTAGVWRDGGGAFERTVCMLSLFGADGRATRQETFDSDREAEALARFDELTATPATSTARRRVTPNAGSAALARVEVAIAARDLDAMASEFGEQFEEVSHPTGITYGREALLDSMRRFLRSPGATARHELLATLGDRLWLFRRWMGGSSAGGGRFDVGAHEKEEVGVNEIDAHGMHLRNEIFAADHLGSAIIRLYERHAELLPEGPERARAAATARAVKAWLVQRMDPDRLTAVLAPQVQAVDHRSAGFGSLRGAEALIAAFRPLLELSKDATWRADDILTLRHDGFVHRATNAGIDRASGGAFERTFCVLLVFGTDGRVTHFEQFDAERAAEALARFDQLVGEQAPAPPQRRVRPNRVTAFWARFDSLFVARDAGAVEASFSDSFAEIDHTTGGSYGRDGAIASIQRLLRAQNPGFRHEPLATLGSSLGLVRGLISASGTGGGRFDVGAYEIEEIKVAEVDEQRKLRSAEVFAADRIGDAVARLYERYAEYLPEGTARSRAASTARTVAAMVAPPDLDRYASALSPAVEFVDHRTVGFAAGRGRDKLLRGFRSLFDLATDIATRVDEVLALEADALLLRWTTSGIDRTGGGAFESAFLLLWQFGADGLVVHDETFDVGREAEALARFDEIVGSDKVPRMAPVRWEGEAPAEPLGASKMARQEPRPPTDPRTRPAARFANAASRVVDRGNAALVAGDWEGFTALFAAEFRHDDRTRMAQVESDGRQWLASSRQFLEMTLLAREQQLLATRGERLALLRMLWRSEEGDIGPSELEWIMIVETDERGDHRAIVSFDPKDLDAAYAELDARYEAGEGAAHPAHGAVMRAFAAAIASRDWEPQLALCAPEFVEYDHRSLALLGTTRGAEAWAQNFRTLTELAPDTVYRVDHFRSAARGFWSVGTWKGTREGGGYEIPINAVLEMDDRDRLARSDIYDADQVDEARARFDELGGGDAPREGDPLRIPPNASTRANDRWWACVEAGDWEALRPLIEPIVFEDRRRLIRIAGGADLLLADSRHLWESGWRPRRTLLATAGDRLSLERMLWVVSDEGQRSEIDVLKLCEVDGDGRIVAYLIFDADDRAAASTELFRRYVAGGADGLPASVLEFQLAANGRDAARVRATLSDGFAFHDHRRIGLGRIEGADAYVASLAALWELTPDGRIDQLCYVALAAHGGIALTRLSGTNSEGGPFESVYVSLVHFERGQFLALEIFDLDDLAVAKARLEELCPPSLSELPPSLSELRRTGPTHAGLVLRSPAKEDPLLIPPNAACRARDRALASFEPRDRPALRALVGRDFTFEDRRRGVLLSGDIELWIKSGESILAMHAQHVRELIATLGDRIALERVLWAGDLDGGAFEIEFIRLVEIDAEGRLAAWIYFDPDDRRAAFDEANARFVAGEAAAIGGQAPIAALLATFIRRDWQAGRDLLAPDLVYHDHRPLGLGTLGRDAWVDSLRALADLAADVHTEAFRTLAWNRGGRVAVCRQMGTTDAGGPFENVFVALWCVDGERICRVEVFAVDEAERAVARFEELCAAPREGDAPVRWEGEALSASKMARQEPRPPTARFANAATRVVDRGNAALAARDWEGFTALFAAEFRHDDRTPMAQVESDGRQWLASFRPFVEMTVAPPEQQLLATRGDRLALFRVLWRGEKGDIGPSDLDWIMIVEVDDRGDHRAVISFAPEDLDAAYAELDARWEAGEAATHPRASAWVLEFQRAFAARDWEAMAALHAPDQVAVNHRTVGWGTLRGPGGWVPTLQALVELAADAQFRLDHLRTCQRGILWQSAWQGTRDGGPFETPLLVATELDDSGRQIRMDVWDAEVFEPARARFAELRDSVSRMNQGFDPLAATLNGNAVTAGLDRWRVFDSGAVTEADWDALRASCAPGMIFEDRQGFARLSGDREMMIASLRERVASGARPERRLLSTAGERLAITRMLWTGGPADGRFEIEYLSVVEVDAAGVVVAIILFGADDARAAQREAWARWAAIDPEAAAVAAPLGDVVDDPLRIPPNAASRLSEAAERAIAARDWEALRAFASSDFRFEDRGRRALVSGDANVWLESVKFLASEHTARLEPELIATVGERIAIYRDAWSDVPGEPRFELGGFRIMELDAEGRLRALILFDAEDRQVAFAEAQARVQNAQ